MTDPDGQPDQPAPETAEHLRVRLLLIEGIDRPWMTVSLLVVLAAIHVGVGGVMFARGNTGLLGIATATRGPRLLTRWGAMSADKLDQGELWRLVSPIFLHGSGFHLLVNCLALYGLGRLCEAVYGPSRFLWLFMLSGVSGALLSWLGGNTLSVGASGSIFGLMGAGLVFGLRYRHELPEDIGHIFRRKLTPWIVLNLFIGAVIPFIDNLGHVGGLLGGSVLAMILGNRVIAGEQTPAVMRGLMLAASLAMFGVAAHGVWGQWTVLR